MDLGLMYKDDDAILESVFCEIEGLMEEDLEAALVGIGGGAAGMRRTGEDSNGSSMPAPYTDPGDGGAGGGGRGRGTAAGGGGRTAPDPR
ncbi:hypothetical protein THAOC_19584, partial [Thalassiosira oceanica]